MNMMKVGDGKTFKCYTKPDKDWISLGWNQFERQREREREREWGAYVITIQCDESEG